MEDNEYIKCPFCNQLDKREYIENGTHVCWALNGDSHKTLGIWDD